MTEETKTPGILYDRSGNKYKVVLDINASQVVVEELLRTKAGENVESGIRKSMFRSDLFPEPLAKWEPYYESMKKRMSEQTEKDYRELATLNDKLTKERVNLNKALKDLQLLYKNLYTDETRSRIKETLEFITMQHKFAVHISDMKLLTLDDPNIGKRLLSLYGNFSGDIFYCINSYGDGSGSDGKMKPFKTKKEALKFLLEVIQAEAESTQSSYSVNKCIDAAKAAGIEVREAWKAKFIKLRTEELTGKKKGLSQQIAQLETEIAKVADGSSVSETKSVPKTVVINL